MAVGWVVFGGDSIVSAEIEPEINYMDMPGARSYSWVETNCKFLGTGPAEL